MKRQNSRLKWKEAEREVNTIQSDTMFISQKNTTYSRQFAIKQSKNCYCFTSHISLHCFTFCISYYLSKVFDGLCFSWDVIWTVNYTHRWTALMMSFTSKDVYTYIWSCGRVLQFIVIWGVGQFNFLPWLKISQPVDQSPP